jgi:hypothetical protein
MVEENSSFCRRCATDAVELLSKRPFTKSVKAKGHLSPSEREGIGKRLFGSLRPAEQELILGFPVIEWDSDNEDGIDHSSDSEGDDEALCRDTANIQVLHPITTVVRPRRLSYPQVLMVSGRESGLVRSKTVRSHLSLLDSRNPSLLAEDCLETGGMSSYEISIRAR